jgi:hypothetical protein
LRPRLDDEGCVQTMFEMLACLLETQNFSSSEVGSADSANPPVLPVGPFFVKECDAIELRVIIAVAVLPHPSTHDPSEQ